MLTSQSQHNRRAFLANSSSVVRIKPRSNDTFVPHVKLWVPGPDDKGTGDAFTQGLQHDSVGIEVPAGRRFLIFREGVDGGSQVTCPIRLGFLGINRPGCTEACSMLAHVAYCQQTKARGLALQGLRVLNRLALGS